MKKTPWKDLPSTIEEIEALPTEVLTCDHVAKVLHADPTTLRKQAQKDPDALGFPVIRVQSRVKIPKQPFVRFMREGRV